MSDKITPAMIRRDRNRREMRETILNAARDILVQEGVSALSMRAVARDIGYSPAALYEYFESKSALCQALFFEGADGLSGRMRSTVESLDPDTHAGIVTGMLGRAYREFALENRELYLLVFSNPVAEFRPDETDRQAANRGYDLLVQTMERGVEHGDMRQLDPNIAALAAWSMVHGFVMLEMLGYVSDNDPEGRDRLFESVLEHVSAWHVKH